MNRLWNPNLNSLRPLRPHGFIMSDSCSDVHDITGSESSTSVESLRSYNDPAEEAEQSFLFACDDARKRLIIQAYRIYHLQQGRTRRSVSGSSGRLLHDTVGMDFHTYKQRIEADLPPEVRGNIDFLLHLLDTSWSAPLPHNDQVFLRGLGGADDPDKTSVLQKFQHFLHRAATELGYHETQARLLADVLSRETKYMLYKPATEFLTRSLPPEYRDQLLRWIADIRLHNQDLIFYPECAMLGGDSAFGRRKQAPDLAEVGADEGICAPNSS